MNSDQETEKRAGRIADAIVELVESTDGPVTLSQLERDIPRFAKKEPPSWEYVVENNGTDTVIWNGMTKAGLAALRNAMSGRRVAVQILTSPIPYLLEGGSYPTCENWIPVVLLPITAANLDTPNWRIRASQLVLQQAAGRQGYRPLTPSTISRTADRFAA
jgi:hypothetical protein